MEGHPKRHNRFKLRDQGTGGKGECNGPKHKMAAKEKETKRNSQQ